MKSHMEYFSSTYNQIPTILQIFLKLDLEVYSSIADLQSMYTHTKFSH